MAMGTGSWQDAWGWIGPQNYLKASSFSSLFPCPCWEPLTLDAPQPRSSSSFRHGGPSPGMFAVQEVGPSHICSAGVPAQIIEPCSIKSSQTTNIIQLLMQENSYSYFCTTV